MIEAPLMILPYIDELTVSELFAIMTSGFGSIAGNVYGVLVGLGVSKFGYSNLNLLSYYSSTEHVKLRVVFHFRF